MNDPGTDDWHERAARLGREASGTFTGHFDPAPELFPVETDTYDEPNPLADAVPGQSLTVDTGTGKRYSMIIDHVEPLGGNLVRAWCLRPERLS